MKWKSPRWISTFWYCSTPLHRNLKVFNAAPTSWVMLRYGMFMVAAKDYNYSTYCWVMENSATFDTNGGRYVSVVFTGCWLGYRFLRTWVNQPLNVATPGSCEFHSQKQSQRKNKELKMFWGYRFLFLCHQTLEVLRICWLQDSERRLASIQLFDVWCGELDNRHLC